MGIKMKKTYRDGKLVHEKYSNGFEKWQEYDQNGNLVYNNRVSDGFEKFY